MYSILLVLALLTNLYREVKHYYSLAPYNTQHRKQKPAPDNHFHALKRAVQDGDIGALKALLATKFDPSARDKYDRTLLMISIATIDPNIEIIRLLIQKGSDVNAQDDLGVTPLILASIFNHQEVVDMLLNSGAKTEARDIYGHTALMKAAMFCDPEVLQILISRGAKVNAKDLSGATPLMLSRESNVETLLDAGADIHAKDQTGYTAIMHAVSQGRLHKIETLINRGCDINARNRNGKTALDVAVEKQFHSAINLLRRAGAKD